MNILVWGAVLFVFLSDQLSKFFVSESLKPGESVAVIKNVFYLTLVRNRGAAFGIFRNQTLLFIVVAIFAVTAVFLYIKRQDGSGPLIKMSLALILGGALGNLTDRLRFGYVVDFFDFRIWPVFNIADSAITVGAFLLIINFICTRYCSK